MHFSRVLLYTIIFSLFQCLHSARAADWTQWGGTNERNMISDEKDLPSTFDSGEKKPDGSGIDMATTKNLKWAVKLGSYTYGNPTVSNGRVFLGTDAKDLDDDERFTYGQGGLVRCLDEETGNMLWQLAIPIRTDFPYKETHFGLQRLGVCSSPTVEGDRVYVVSSAGDILCLDVAGQTNGNDGPFKDEATYMAEKGAEPIELGPKDGDIIWRYDPLEKLAVSPHDAASCSVLIVGDYLYTSTSNGVDKPHEKVVNPLAPSLIVLDKHSGKLVATDNEKIGSRLYHAQWSSPSAGKVGDKTLVFFGGGDGFCYAFEALLGATDKPVHLKKAWAYDCNPEEYKYRNGKLIGYYEGDKRKKYSTNDNDGKYIGPSQIIATPVFHNGRIYVSIGQDPAHGRGRGLMYCLDAANGKPIWTYDKMDRSISTVAVDDGLVYSGDIAGLLHCLDAESGECFWTFDTDREMWGGPLAADGKLFFGNKDSFFILSTGKKIELLSKVRLGNPVYSTPIVANGAVYIASNRYLYVASLGK
jgi:outer membrane protein assembly factor BamB